jgi:hypothetical protein
VITKIYSERKEKEEEVAMVCDSSHGGTNVKIF